MSVAEEAQDELVDCELVPPEAFVPEFVPEAFLCFRAASSSSAFFRASSSWFRLALVV